MLTVLSGSHQTLTKEFGQRSAQGYTRVPSGKDLCAMSLMLGQVFCSGK